MKFTSEDLMKAMGLQVGDRVKVNLVNGKTKIYEVIKYLSSLNEEKICLTENKSLSYLLNVDFEILPRPKRVGDTYCQENCENCPLMCVCDADCDYEGQTLFDVFNYELIAVHNDQEIYDLLKARLDKEVIENVG